MPLAELLGQEPTNEALILLVEDNPGDARLIAESLGESEDFPARLLHVERLSEALTKLESAPIEVVLLDLSLPDSTGLDTFYDIKAAAEDAAIVVLSGLHDEEVGLQAVRAGAQDYLVKGQVSNSTMVRSLRYALERRKSEQKLRDSAKQKEVMLREIHHRVKNNLQVISSILSLQSRKITDQKVWQMFEDCRNRVNSMALVHEELYKTDNLAIIDFGDYIKNLASNLFHSYGGDRRGLKLSVQVERAFIKLDSAIPCGLILNELVSNALKHAFPPGRQGTISVVFQASEEGTFILSVSDDGTGFPPNSGQAIGTTHSTLGLELVEILTKQVGGTLQRLSTNGTTFVLNFKE
ncbi:MAG: hypothetical protein DCC75_04135 [Proteobacteria bacterium]|nr:MAG: hypothetical protein DCC75_04135 [Pseudomonadota bacterium]